MEKLLKLRKTDPAGFFSAARKIIEQMTEVTNNHELVPKLSLRLVTPNCPLWTGNFEKCPLQDPFWSIFWPGGQALTRFLIENKNIIEGKSVLDLGSGCGSLSIAAAKIGKASQITANDIDPIAAVALELNSRLNGCPLNSIKFLGDDLVGSSGKLLASKYDCIFLGDMFYDEQFNNTLMNWLLELSTKTDVLIGDPGRNSNFSSRYRKNVVQAAEYEVSEEFRKSNDLTSNYINVWKLFVRS